MVVYWLIPSPPAQDFFASEIDRLAQRFDAPLFEPHLTVYVNSAPDGKAATLVAEIAAQFEPIDLPVEGLRYSEEFTKTLFVQFGKSTWLAKLSTAIQSRSVHGSDYPLNPHVSLLYKKLPREQKAEIASAIRLPFDEVSFDALTAVTIPREVKTPEDVIEWQTLARQPLGPPGRPIL